LSLEDRNWPDVRDLEEWSAIEVDPDLVLGTKQELGLEAGGKFVAVELVKGRLFVRAKGYVGVLPLTERLTLNIVPRVDIRNNLARITTVANYLPMSLPDVLREYATEAGLAPSVVQPFAEGLERATREIQVLGLMKDYVRREEDSSYPRGRVLAGPTMQHWGRGVHHRARSSWFQRTADIPVNQCLLYAVHSLSATNTRLLRGRHATEARRVAQLLNNCASRLGGVSLVPRDEFRNDPYVSGRIRLPDLRAYYGPGLELARTIAAGQGVDALKTSGPLELGSLLVDLSDVFQHYVRNVINTAGQSRAWPAEVLDGNKSPPVGALKPLLDGGPFQAKPDVVIARAGEGAADVVVEVKYVPADGPPSIDAVHQALAYGFSYGATNVVIAQPSATGSPPSFSALGSVGGVTLHHFVMDLAGDLATEERRLADAVQGLAKYA
jgi:5-methylcytosine-specific restriction enzyme subunit McrC